jgi:hypothetical protein
MGDQDTQPGGRKIWFPAKRYGWGWGPPNCWQGWVVFAAWLLLLAGGAAWLIPAHVEFFVPYAVVLAIILCVVCYIKGEKPRWRWGKD